MQGQYEVRARFEQEPATAKSHWRRGGRAVTLFSVRLDDREFRPDPMAEEIRGAERLPAPLYYLLATLVFGALLVLAGFSAYAIAARIVLPFFGIWLPGSTTK